MPDGIFQKLFNETESIKTRNSKVDIKTHAKTIIAYAFSKENKGKMIRILQNEGINNVNSVLQCIKDIFGVELTANDLEGYMSDITSSKKFFLSSPEESRKTSWGFRSRKKPINNSSQNAVPPPPPRSRLSHSSDYNTESSDDSNDFFIEVNKSNTTSPSSKIESQDSGTWDSTDK